MDYTDKIEKKIYIRKKAGNLENWNPSKIVKAIGKSAHRANEILDENDINKVVELVWGDVNDYASNVIPVDTIHTFVEKALRAVNPDIAESYMNYRNWIKREAEMNAKVWEECQSIQFLGDKSNANADSALVSTKRVKKTDVLETNQYQHYFLNKEEKIAQEIGYIYVHDKSARLDTMNCCLFGVKNVLDGGFEMSNVWYNEPKSLRTAFSVIGDITLMAASQQYGGFTLPEVDKVLEPYAEKSYEKYYSEYLEILTDGADVAKPTKKMLKKADEYAEKKVLKDMDQGFQGWEYKFNTVASSRGDYPFITATFGLCNTRWGKALCKSILKTRQGGQGKEGFKKPVLFPKLVFLYDKDLHSEGCDMYDVFEAGIACSSKTMYPDWLSLTGEGYVPSMYKKYKKAISPMGCRAFLSPWYKTGLLQKDENGNAKLDSDGNEIRDHFYPAEDVEDEPVFIGRFNIGAITLNLPMILAKSRRDGVDFYETLDYYMEMIRGIHQRTYDYIANMRASMNPLGFCQGGFYGGNLNPDDKIGTKFLKPMTASFGVTALNELQELYNGKSIREDGEFCLEVMKYINDKVAEYKRLDGWAYAIYGTPAESLCGLQIKQFRKEFGIITNVSDRPYTTNSFHCHVTENMSPIEKQDKEKRFWDYFNGGKIQYCRYHLGYNRDAIKSLVVRAMGLGFYEGVNLSLAYCDDCGHEEPEMDVCPVCGSKRLTKIDRMNGYLAFSRIGTDANSSRLNMAKMAEIADRVSM